ncbi:insulin-like growth factor-binding protein complex acid labile subunit [Bacillus rossius redtenbacheri]|uniref:insulin-like growth factor-binding protein complex acid labile subunit n=1 Tax=Bacillus rossius redtenbacheri TaxID=93214 RepID=UPI002FDDD385
MRDHIPVQALDPQLEVLKISAPPGNPNHLTIGPIFQGFSQLEELRIVRSNVPAIGRHSFWGVPTLRVLDLSHNDVSQALDYNFRGLANLLELRLDDNRVESLPSGTFRHLPELRLLSLARNRIQELVPRLFLMLGKLQELDLSRNRLVELSPEVFKDVQELKVFIARCFRCPGAEGVHFSLFSAVQELKELKVFRCRGCGLSNVNSLIYQLLPDLVHLDLGDNEFKYVDSDEFRNLRRLQVLRLDGNQLPVVLEKTFSGSPVDGHLDLRHVDLARNRLAVVTAQAFANLSTLRQLDLSYNKLDRLDAATFLPMADSLRSLNLSGNTVPLAEVKYFLQQLPRLRDLGLADMGVSQLPADLFGYHEHLKTLNLSGNHFTHLPAQRLSAVPKLYELDLSRNRFRGLDDRLLLRLEAVKRVHLRDNPWVCDLCNVMPLLSRANRSSPSSWLDLRQLRCDSPHHLRSRHLHSLRPAALEWCIAGDQGPGYADGSGRLHDNPRAGFVAAGIAVLLLLLAASALLAWLAYSRHHAARYYTREEARGPEREAIFENPAAVLGDSGDIKYKIVAAGPAADSQHPAPLKKKKKKTVTICTIDSIAKDPELRTLTNGT